MAENEKDLDIIIELDNRDTEDDTFVYANKPLNLYLKQVDELGIKLDKQDELTLIEKFQTYGDKDARNMVVYNNLKFVVFIGKSWFNKYIDNMEIVSAGNEGLIKAVEKFDTERGVDFRTFASHYISAYITRYIASSTSDGLSFELVRLRGAVNKILNRMGHPEHLTEVDYSNIADEVNKNVQINHREVNADDIKNIIEFSAPKSLNEVVAQDSYSVEIGDTVVDDMSTDKYDEAENRVILAKMFGELNDREKMIVYEYYFNNKPLGTIAELSGVSRQAIHHVMSRALQKMKAAGLKMGYTYE